MNSWVGYLAAICTTVCYIPQAWHVIRERKTAGISLPAYLVLFVGVTFWAVYGVMIDSWPVILANGVSLPLLLVIIVMKLRLG
jgi:MtN3 and saliva related transmembrane protein